MPPTLAPPDHLATADISSGHPPEVLAIPANSNRDDPIPLPRLGRVTPFSKQASIGHERNQEYAIASLKTVIKNGLPANYVMQSTSQNEEIQVKDDSFHGDRTLLPSQRKR
jgi:hypothetical protein